MKYLVIAIVDVDTSASQIVDAADPIDAIVKSGLNPFHDFIFVRPLHEFVFTRQLGETSIAATAAPTPSAGPVSNK